MKSQYNILVKITNIMVFKKNAALKSDRKFENRNIYISNFVQHPARDM